jgi:hypothetical protein
MNRTTLPGQSWRWRSRDRKWVCSLCGHAATSRRQHNDRHHTPKPPTPQPGPPAPGATADGRFVLKIISVAGVELATDPTDVAGQYLASYDPEWGGGIGRISTSRTLDGAARWPALDAAIACILHQPQAKPTRADGQPNRPLRTYNLLVQTIHQATRGN